MANKQIRLGDKSFEAFEALKENIFVPEISNFRTYIEKAIHTDYLNFKRCEYLRFLCRGKEAIKHISEIKKIIIFDEEIILFNDLNEIPEELRENEFFKVEEKEYTILADEPYEFSVIEKCKKEYAKAKIDGKEVLLSKLSEGTVKSMIVDNARNIEIIPLELLHLEDEYELEDEDFVGYVFWGMNKTLLHIESLKDRVIIKDSKQTRIYREITKKTLIEKWVQIVYDVD